MLKYQRHLKGKAHHTQINHHLRIEVEHEVVLLIAEKSNQMIYLQMIG